MARSYYQAKLIEKLNDAISVQALSIVQGGARSYDKYRETVGYIRGLTDAIKLAEETEKDIEE